MNPDDYDEDGNCIVPCPICLNVHCPGNQFDQNGNKIGDGKCPEEDEFVRAMEEKELEAEGDYPTREGQPFEIEMQ